MASGIVKIPRVPVADNTMMGEQPTYRDLWFHIRDALPRKGRSTDAISGPPRIPKELEGALTALYGHPRRTAEVNSAAPPNGAQVWLFPQILAIVKRWLAECVRCKDNTFPQLLLLVEKAHHAAEKIHRAIAAASGGEPRVRAVLQPYDTLGTTASVSYDTTKPRWTSAPDTSHINFVPCDSNWEAKFAQSLEEMDEVKAYVKNQSLGFKIPYTFEGRPGNYYADYLLRVDDGYGMDDLLNLIVEVSGQELQQKEAKVDTATKLWVPAVNAEQTFGRWAFLEIDDPWDAQTILRTFLDERRGLSPP